MQDHGCEETVELLQTAQQLHHRGDSSSLDTSRGETHQSMDVTSDVSTWHRPGLDHSHLSPKLNTTDILSHIHSAADFKNASDFYAKATGVHFGLVDGKLTEVDPATGEECSLCGTPTADRIAPGVVYQKRTDCGSAKDTPGYKDVPLITYSKKATATRAATNAWCELNSQKVCADSVYNKDYLYQAKVVHYDPSMTFDPWYCYHNGWLEPKLIALTHDFEAMDKHQHDMCHSQKYLKYEWNTTLNLRKMEQVYSAGMNREPQYPTPEEATFLGAWNCAMGTAGCDISYCLYSFCVLKYEYGGTPVFGMYDECEGWDPVKGMPIPES